MDEEKLRKILEETLKDEDIEKVEEILLEENMKKKKKIEELKRLISEKKYNIEPEEIAEKLLKFFELEQED